MGISYQRQQYIAAASQRLYSSRSASGLSKMVQLEGTYEIVSNTPNIKDFLKSTGAPEKLVEHIISARTIVKISQNDGEWTALTLTDGKETSATFRPGELYDEALPQGIVFKSVSTLDGNTVTTESTLPDGRKATRVYEFTEDGIISTVSTENGPKATRTYKRL